MGIHESQSLFWERYVGLSREFWELTAADVHELFPHTAGGATTAEDFYSFVNKVSESFIRVEADELTYSLHVILRFEVERGLFDGSIQVADVPRVWNEKMRQYLGAEPPSDRLGCLQDMHWSGGAFGYFPSYSLGALPFEDDE